MALRPRTPGARAILPVTRSRASGQLEALLSSPVLDVRLITALQVLQVLLAYWEKRERGLCSLGLSLSLTSKVFAALSGLLTRVDRRERSLCAKAGF